MKKIFLFLLCLSLVIAALSGCESSNVQSDGTTDGSDASVSDTDSSDGSGGSSDLSAAPDSSGTASFAQNSSDMFTERDLDAGYDESSCIRIELSGSTATASSDSVKISGSTVTITEEATYIISGSLDDGMIVVNANDTAKPKIVLNGASVTSSSSAPLYILEADKVFLTLASNSENTLSAGDSFTAIDDNNIDGAIFSKQDLTINGSGSLTVSSPACHGIVCKDDLVISGGSITVKSASHGIDANDSVRIAESAVLSIDSGKDGIHAENSDDTSLGFVYISGGTIGIDAEGDGISSGAYMQIAGGTLDIVSGGGSTNASKQTSDSWGNFMGGMGGGRGQSFSKTESDTDSTSIKGLKSTGDMLISGGSFTIDSADDSVHSNASVTVDGGSFDIASGDDAFHADDTLTVNAGTINISESYEGLEGLHIAVTGGDISLVASDDGLNAAGGTDSSGFGGDRGGDTFGNRGGMGGPGDMGGMSSSSNGSIVISGGKLYINASGDGIDANGSLTISGGYTVVCGPTQGDTATLDYDTSAVISGGTFIGTGASGMAQTFSDSEQGMLAINVGNRSAGTTVSVVDADGNTVISYAPELNFAVVILSSPELVSGEKYTINIGSDSGVFEAS